MSVIPWRQAYLQLSFLVYHGDQYHGSVDLLIGGFLGEDEAIDWQTEFETAFEKQWPTLSSKKNVHPLFTPRQTEKMPETGYRKTALRVIPSPRGFFSTWYERHNVPKQLYRISPQSLWGQPAFLATYIPSYLEADVQRNRYMSRIEASARKKERGEKAAVIPLRETALVVFLCLRNGFERRQIMLVVRGFPSEEWAEAWQMAFEDTACLRQDTSIIGSKLVSVTMGTRVPSPPNTPETWGTIVLHFKNMGGAEVADHVWQVADWLTGESSAS